MKAVKEKEQLLKTVDSWKDSSKNLWRLIDSGMSSNSKVGLGFEIQSNNEVLSFEEEMNFSVFKCSKEDSMGKPLYSRFTKTNDFKGVPHPLSGDYTPKPQEEIDDSLYVYGKKGPQKPEISVSDDNSSEHSTCQSNDSEGSCGNTSEHSFETESESLSEPNEMSKSRLEVTNEKVVSELQEVEPSCAKHVKTPRQPLKDKETHKVNRKNWNDMMERELGEGYSFTKKKCFVCGSLNHLIKDCDYYEKKMAREAEVKRVVNTGNRVAKPVWTNANRINHANKLVPRSVQLNTGRTNINSVRPKVNAVSPKINSVRPKVNAVSPKVNAFSPKVNTVRPRQLAPHKTSNSLSPKRPQMNQINQRRDFSKSYSSVRRPFAKSTAQMTHSNAVMGSWGTAVKTSASYNWRNSRPNFNYNSGPTFIRTVNANGPQGRPKPAKAWVHNEEPWFLPVDAKATSENLNSGIEGFGLIKFKKPKQTCEGNLAIQPGPSCKAKLERLITEPLHTLHMDLFGPTSVKSINHASYCLVITDDCTRFEWGILFGRLSMNEWQFLQTFIRQIKNQLSHRVKIIRSDNGTEFKNRDMLEFCGNKGIKQEYSNARTPQQNGVAERMNRTLIEAARTMLAVLLSSSQHSCSGQKQLVLLAIFLIGVSWQFDGNIDEGFLINQMLKEVGGYRWMFDIDYLTDSMNYIPVSLENQANPHAELIVVPSAVRNSEEIVDSRTSSTKSKKEKILTDPQQEEKVSSTDTLEDNPKIQAFRKRTVNTGRLDHDDSSMPELKIFYKSETGIFDLMRHLMMRRV
ncbi:putative ribonuclease H-like domain-containing protein [Tanacetum coccineum]